ncbi:carboxypeptidase regulatory-like domain-containing protein [bacterium SCSIO 12741]|nr:carboxypeptidase regulatory-like domain-containing protein [bacterium SCSIO 12741]
MQQIISGIFFSLIFLVSSSAYGQEVAVFGDEDDSTALENNVLVNAQVTLKNRPFSQVEVKLYHGKTLLRETTTGEDGFFTLILEFDSLYHIKFRKEGYVTKLVEVDTREVPGEDQNIGYDLGMFKLDMIPRESGTNYDLYREPLARFMYDDISMNFVVDRKHKKSVKKRFEQENQKPDVIHF